MALAKGGRRGRAGDVQLGKMSVGIEAAHVKWFTRQPGRGRERPLSLFVTPQGVRPWSDRDLRRSQGPGALRSSGAAGNGWPASFGSAGSLVGPRGGEPPVRAEFAWHRKAVYRGPERLFGREVEE